jgi:hypothetical protein
MKQADIHEIAGSEYTDASIIEHLIILQLAMQWIIL